MNIVLLIWLIILFYNNFVNSGAEDFISKVVAENTDLDFAFHGINNVLLAGANMISTTSELSHTHLYDQNLENQLIIVITPTNFSHFDQTFEMIGKFYSKPKQIWKPLFFVAWPKVKVSTTSAHAEFRAISDYFIVKPLDLSIRLNSDVYIILETKSSNLAEIIIIEMYHVKRKFVIQKVNISPAKFAIISNYNPKAARRRNFNRVNINAVGLADPDYEYQCKLEEINGTVRFVSGNAVGLLHTLQYALNFSYTAVKGEGWIEQLENGTWTGMAKQVRNQEADLGISQSQFLPYRIRGLGFLHPTAYSYIKAFFRQPPPSSMRNIFISPFSTNLWICLLSSWILLICCLNAFHWIRLKFTDAQIESSDEELVDECVLWTISTLCQQGWYGRPSALSMKILLLFGSVLGLVYYVAFCAALVSTLSVEIVPIQNIDDLAQSKLEIWGDVWMPNNHKLVESILEKRKKVVTPTEHDQYMEIDHAMPKLLEKSSAYMTFADGFKTVFNRLNYTDHLYCDQFSSLNVMKAVSLSAMIVLKDSPYKDVFNHKILMMREVGINSRFMKHYGWGTVAMCPKKTRKGHDKLGIKDVFTAYLLLICGFSISALLLGIECLTCMFAAKFRLNIRKYI